MTIHILEGDIHLADLKTRMPFKYGIATLTQAPYTFVRMRVDLGGWDSVGVSADLLPPKWFTKDPTRPVEPEIGEMLDVIEHAVEVGEGMKAATPFDAWRQLWDAQDTWGRERGFPPLLTHFGTSLVERAMLDAFCRGAERHWPRSFYWHLRGSKLGTNVGAVHDELNGFNLPEFLKLEGGTRVIVRHTVGLADPLRDEDLPDGERLDDGLPQSLEACIKEYGLYHFKLKVSGVFSRDVPRMRRIAELLEPVARRAKRFGFSLDGNEQFRSVDQFRDYWKCLTAEDSWAKIGTDLLFVEQPFHRDVALDPDAMVGLRQWQDRPPIIIDESDGDLTSLPRALSLGYQGTSHKNCKGVFKGIANACLLELHRRRGERVILSGEDLANVGPVALLQDLAVSVALGVESIERNGHHYFAGLSMFPEAVQKQILSHHGDLYHPSRDGWPTLDIRQGELHTGTVAAAPFGVTPLIDVEQFPSSEEWRRLHPEVNPGA